MSPKSTGSKTIDLSIISYILLFTGSIFVGMSKAGFAGTGIFGIIIFAAVLPARESVGMILPLLIIADLLAIFTFVKYVDWKQVFTLAPPATLGVIGAWFLMPHISDANFAPFIGVLILCLLLMMLWLRFSPALTNFTLRHPHFGKGMGFLAGLTSMLANAGGPPASLYLLTRKLPKMAFVGTGAWYFFFLNLFKVPFSSSMGLINKQSLLLDLQILPFIIIGFFTGLWLLNKINQTLFEWSVITLILPGSLYLIFSPIFLK
ncbi:MAG: sulfite exporter TauE/SafE family protein [Chthoniobacterales bacterium]